MDIYEAVYKVVSSIPKGNVLTYGEVARLAGIRSPREVGRILHKNPDPENVPCHRVVYGDGRVSPSYAFGGAVVQLNKLKKEGVKIRKGKVVIGSL